MTLAADRRAAAAELDYLVGVLEPPVQLGMFALTGHLARSATAALYTARGPLFGPDIEGVLKLTGSAFAPILERELGILSAAARADVSGVVRPLKSDLLWLAAGGDKLDRPVAALALPFLSGGDLASLVARASRVGELGPHLALQVARPLAEALRGLLIELDQPVVHGDLRAQHLLLPSPDAPLSELTLIDFDAARDTSPAGTDADADDVRAFGELLAFVATGDARSVIAGDRSFSRLVHQCVDHIYRSMADPALWRDLAAAESHAASGSKSKGVLGTVRDVWRRVQRR
jgi:hypothetical protein